MNKSLLIIALIFASSVGFAQEKKSKKIKTKSLYLTYKADSLWFYTNGDSQSDEERMASTVNFTMKNNACNLYLNWLNPLKYEVVWSDTSYADQRDVLLKEFIGKLIGQFGFSDELIGALSDGSKIKRIEFVASKDTINSYANETLYFKDFEVFNWYSSMLDTHNYNKATINNIKILNNVIYAMKTIEEDLSLTNFTNLESYFEQLLGSTNIKTAEAVVGRITTQVGNWDTQNLEPVKKKIGLIRSRLKEKDFEFNNSIEHKKSSIVIERFLTRMEAQISKYENLIETLKKLAKEVSDSYSTQVSETNFVKTRYVEIDNGKVLESTIKISERSYDKKTKTFGTSKLVLTRTLKFTKYDWISPRVATGLFYANVGMPGFGVSTDDMDQLLVTQNDIGRSNATAAIFGKLDFSLNSRYFAPGIELGIDPTKKRPFFLLGGGFTIPAIEFGISAGWIWTWKPELTEYRLGDVVESTSALESDITHKFDMNPSGWYLGIHYNF